MRTRAQIGKRRFFFGLLPFPPYPGGGCTKGGGPPAPGYPTCCPGMAITGMFVLGPYMGGEYHGCEAGRCIGGACTACGFTLWLICASRHICPPRPGCEVDCG